MLLRMHSAHTPRFFGCLSTQPCCVRHTSCLLAFQSAQAQSLPFTSGRQARHRDTSFRCQAQWSLDCWSPLPSSVSYSAIATIYHLNVFATEPDTHLRFLCYSRLQREIAVYTSGDCNSVSPQAASLKNSLRESFSGRTLLCP